MAFWLEAKNAKQASPKEVALVQHLQELDEAHLGMFVRTFKLKETHEKKYRLTMGTGEFQASLKVEGNDVLVNTMDAKLMLMHLVELQGGEYKIGQAPKPPL